MPTFAARHVVGNVLLDLVKFLKNHESVSGPLSLNDEARSLFATRIATSRWYPLSTLHELLRALDLVAIKGSEQRALALGAAGGTAVRGLQKTYVVAGDPRTSVIAMRHAWRAHYDFGQITHEEGAAEVRFAIEGYDDIPMVHAMMTAGWGLGAARAAGSEHAAVHVVHRPWRGGERFTFRIQLGSTR